MKVTLLGTNGFLSKAIACYCNEKGYELEMYGLSVPVGSIYDKYYKVNFLNDELDYEQMNRSDIIVYVTGAGIQSNLHESIDLIYGLNVTVPLRICNELKKMEYKGIFVTFGSVFEMGETCERHFFTEKDVLTSINVAPNDYTISKRMLSRFVSSYKHEFTHWHFYIPTIYGEGENPMRLIPYTINSIRSKKIPHFTNGDQIRQYVHVSEVPSILDKAWQKSLPDGLYNIQGMETWTVREIVTTIYHTLGQEVPSGCFGTVQCIDVGMKYLALDGSKLKHAIGFEPSIHITDVINRY